jgi:Tetratricopeptide repeat
LRQVFPADNWRIAWAESLLGGSLVAQGRFEEAEPLLVRALPLLRAQRSDRDPRTRRARDRLVELYRAWDKPAKVEETMKSL